MGLLGSIGSALSSGLGFLNQNAGAIGSFITEGSALASNILAATGNIKASNLVGAFGGVAPRPLPPKKPTLSQVGAGFPITPISVAGAGGFVPAGAAGGGFMPGRNFSTPGDRPMALLGSGFLGGLASPQFGDLFGLRGLLGGNGNGNGGAVAAGGACPPMFRAGTATARPIRDLTAVNPVTGKVEFWRHMGRPILFSGDLAQMRRTRKIGAKFASRSRRFR